MDKTRYENDQEYREKKREYARRYYQKQKAFAKKVRQRMFVTPSNAAALSCSDCVRAHTCLIQKLCLPSKRHFQQVAEAVSSDVETDE